MGSRSRDYTPAQEKDPADLDDNAAASVNEARPVAYLAGTRRIAVVWISRVYRQRTVPAPVERPGKK
jgi:hypothetical protein